MSAYAYSHGLETAVAEGRVRDVATCGAWIATVLARGAGRLDAWAIRAVLGGADADAVSDRLRARAGSAECWEETRDMGAAFARAAGVAPGPLPVALARAAGGMAPEPVVALYLQAFAGQLASAALRLVPLGAVAAQEMLARLHPRIAVLAAETHDGPPGAAALMAEIDAMAHETLQPRLFRT